MNEPNNNKTNPLTLGNPIWLKKAEKDRYLHSMPISLPYGLDDDRDSDCIQFNRKKSAYHGFYRKFATVMKNFGRKQRMFNIIHCICYSKRFHFWYMRINMYKISRTIWWTSEAHSIQVDWECFGMALHKGATALARYISFIAISQKQTTTTGNWVHRYNTIRSRTHTKKN